MNWRTVFTDSGSQTGVAPVCEDGNHVARLDPGLVFDCCPRPHIETWGESSARNLAEVLTGLDAEVA